MSWELVIGIGIDVALMLLAYWAGYRDGNRDGRVHMANYIAERERRDHR